MENKYWYGAGAIIIIILAIILLSKGDSQKTEDTSTATTTPEVSETNTSVKPVNSTPSVSSASPKPSAGNTVGILPKSAKPPVTSTPSKLNLAGSVFHLTSYNGTAVPASYKYTLSFDGENLSAKFCNSMGGSYVVDDETITARNLASTKMYCTEPANIMGMETAFGSILGYGAVITQVGNTLTISNMKNTVFTFEGFGN